MVSDCKHLYYLHLKILNPTTFITSKKSNLRIAVPSKLKGHTSGTYIGGMGGAPFDYVPRYVISSLYSILHYDDSYYKVLVREIALDSLTLTLHTMVTRLRTANISVFLIMVSVLLRTLQIMR